MPFFYYFDPYYWMILVPAMLIALVAQIQVSSTFNRYSKVRSARGMTGAQAAEAVLRANGVSGVAIERVGGLLDRGAKIDRVLTGQIATSEAYAMKNMRRTHQQLFDEAEKNVKALHDMGIKKVAGNIGTVFGCPIQGKVPIERAYEFVDRMFDIGFDEVEHSDPDGIATPRDIVDYFQVILERHPDPAQHSFHIHDIRGMGMAGYYAAMLAGIRTFDCTVGGIGGQVANFLDGVPVKGAGDYYFDTRRTGLVSTEDFVTMVNGMGIHTGVDQEKLYALGRNLEKMLGRQLHSFTSTVRSGLGA